MPLSSKQFQSVRILSLTVFLFLFSFSLNAQAQAAVDRGRTTMNLPSGTEVMIPLNYTLSAAAEQTFQDTGVELRLYSRSFSQGEAIYLEARPRYQPTTDATGNPITPDFEATVYFNNSKVSLTKKPWGYRGFIGIAVNHKTGKQSLKVTYKLDNVSRTASWALHLNKTDFPVSRTKMKLGKYSNTKTYTKQVLDRIKQERALKNKVFKSWSADMWDARMSHPRDMHKVTSPFYIKRIKDQYTIKNGKRVNLKPLIRYHRGLDLRGTTGEPVFALARGKVVLARELFFEGNMVVIDHGLGIFSYYMHQHTISVQEGQTVEAGEMIGSVGASGAVTGAHLHISLKIRGVQVDPLSVLPLPVRN